MFRLGDYDEKVEYDQNTLLGKIAHFWQNTYSPIKAFIGGCLFGVFLLILLFGIAALFGPHGIPIVHALGVIMIIVALGGFFFLGSLAT